MKKSMLWAALAVLTITLGTGSAWAQVCNPICGLDYAKVMSNGKAGGGGGGPVIVR